MRVVVTSDFHHRPPPKVPPCDLLLIAGDVLFVDEGRTYSEKTNPITSFAGWLDAQPAKDVIGIAGNVSHDWIAYDAGGDAELRALPWKYLRNEAVTVQGVKVWGSPAHLPFNSGDADESRFEQLWAGIPEDVDVVMTHGPAYGILDKTRSGNHVGSRTLRDRLGQLPRLRLFVTGHIHEQYGTTTFTGINAQPVRCVNGSYLTAHYSVGNDPIEVEL